MRRSSASCNLLAMRARRSDWELLGKGMATALLAFALFLQAALSGRGELRAVSPAFDPASAICTAHPGQASVPNGGDEAPAKPHDLCCILLCGLGNGPLPDALPASAPAFLPPAQQALSFGRLADGLLHPARRRACHGARAPPVSA